MLNFFLNKKSGSNASANELESGKLTIEVANAADIADRVKKAGELNFVFEGRVFKTVKPKTDIPGLGIRSAIEICCDPIAQKYLVENKCSAIEEVL